MDETIKAFKEAIEQDGMVLLDYHTSDDLKGFDVHFVAAEQMSLNELDRDDVYETIYPSVNGWRY